jgi:hypothetical protein
MRSLTRIRGVSGAYSGKTWSRTFATNGTTDSAEDVHKKSSADKFAQHLAAGGRAGVNEDEGPAKIHHAQNEIPTEAEMPDVSKESLRDAYGSARDAASGPDTTVSEPKGGGEIHMPDAAAEVAGVVEFDATHPQDRP